jgi:hypothetical protein
MFAFILIEHLLTALPPLMLTFHQHLIILLQLTLPGILILWRPSNVKSHNKGSVPNTQEARPVV